MTPAIPVLNRTNHTIYTRTPNNNPQSTEKLRSRFQQPLLLHACLLILHSGRAIAVASHVLQSVAHDGVVAGGVGIFGSGHARVARPTVLPERVVVAALCVVQEVVAGADWVADADDAFGRFAARGAATGRV